MKRRILRIALLLLLVPLVGVAGPIRIDGSSEAAANRTFQRMLQSLKPDQQQALVIAVIQINLIGVESAYGLVGNADLQHPSAARIRTRIAGMSAPEIIAFAAKNATTTAHVKGEEPGVPAELLRPLAGGAPSQTLADTTWMVDDEINGHLERDVYALHADHTMTLIESARRQGGAARWEQAGDEVRLSFGDGYSVYLGKLVDATTMRGDGGNRTGAHWTWTATRR